GARAEVCSSVATAPVHALTLSLHDALPIFRRGNGRFGGTELAKNNPHVTVSIDGGGGRVAGIQFGNGGAGGGNRNIAVDDRCIRSEEHTSELQSREKLVCRLLLEKKNTH